MTASKGFLPSGEERRGLADPPGVTGISFHVYSLEDGCQRMRRCGYRSMEIWKDQLAGCPTPALRRQVRAFLGRAGLSLSALNVVGAEYHRPFGSPEEFAQTVAGLRGDIDLARELGVRDVLIWDGVRPREGLGQSRDWMLARLTDLLQDGLAYARPFGMRILAEPHPFTAAMDVAFAQALYDRLDSEHFGYTVDLCHYGAAHPRDYAHAIGLLAHRIRHVHLADGDLETSELHYPPGLGRMDIAAVLKVLKQVGFSGSMVLDLYSYPLPEEGSRQGIPHLLGALEFLGIPHSA